MRNLLLIAATAAALAACATADEITGATEQALQTRWTGRSADDFVSEYGLPLGQYQLQNGDTLLAWGDRQSRHVPVFSTTSGYVSPTTGFFITNTETSGGYVGELACDVQLTVSKDRTIKAIRIMGDTDGFREPSRCAEIFR